jgi:hypothetical protein
VSHPSPGALIASVGRTTRITPLIVSSGLGIVVIAAPLLLGGQLGVFVVIFAVRCAMITTALGVAFILDDQALHSTAVLPFSRARMFVLRSSIGLSILTVAWITQLAIAPLIVAPGQSALPWVGLALEPVTLALWTVAIAAFAVRRRQEGSGGVVAAPLLILMIVGLALLPDDRALFPPAFTPQFDASRWWWAGCRGAGVLLWLVAVREPSAR